MRTLGVILSGILNHDYLGEIFRGIADTAKQHRCELLVNIQNRARQDNLALLLEDGICDGVVVVAPYAFAHVLEECRRYHRPYALIDYPLNENIDDVITVESQNYPAIRGVVDYLVGLGHRRIGYINGTSNTACAQQRLQGYLDAVRDAELDCDPALIGQGNWEQRAAFYTAKAMLTLPNPPTAIIAASDLSAFGVMQAARQAGLTIGQQLSITGFDDIRGAALSTPPLTTVRQPIYQLGQTAVELLIQQLNGETLPQLHVALPTELIIRQSTGPRTGTNR